jgi:hypothetical protein
MMAEPQSGTGSGLVYVEYVSRRPGVTLAEFHAVQGRAQQGWATGHGEDVLLWSGARTWRLGPEPECVVVWYTPGAGLERLDAWDRLFRAGADEEHERTVRQVSRIEVAGCYTPLRPPVPARGGIYYVEYFRLTGTLEAARALYDRRAGAQAGVTLNLVAHRIGGLAPDPGGIAVWTIPDFAALEGIASALDGGRDPVELRRAGTYHDIGREIL